MTKTKSTKRALVSSVLALLMCITMLIGTTFAWFTDSVSSENNIIKSGNLDVGMYWADGGKAVPAVDSTAWNDAGKGPMFTYENWEPGYVEAKHILVTNEGSLAFNYELRITTSETLSKLANVIDVYYFETATALNRSNVESGEHLGTLTDVMGTSANISNKVFGSLDADATRSLSLAFKMQESADNKYQGLTLGNFTVQILATQQAKEPDSFDSKYDEKALSKKLPAARVMSVDPAETISFIDENGQPVEVIGENLAINATAGIGGAATSINLNTAYKFEPTQTYEDMMKSEYKYYLADFIISADRDVPGDSMALAGYYRAWCEFNNNNWVAISSPGTVTAGTEIRLVRDGLGVPVHYKDICEYGNDGLGFMCGAIDLTGQNAGTTLTVKLCLFETTADPNGPSANDIETGSEPIVIGEFKYTFPAKKVANQTDLTEAINNGVPIVELAAGTYKVPSAVNGKTVTIKGTEDTKIDVTSGLTYINGSTVTFDGVTIQSKPAGAGYENGFADAAYTVFNNCVIEGTLGLDYSCEFNNCTFNVSGNYYNVWTWGAGTATFNECTFNCDGKAMLVYANVLDNGTTHQTVNITRCKFNDKGDDTVTGKAAIEITNTYTPIRTYDIIINETTVNGFSQTVPGAGDFNAAYGSVAGSDIGTNVWGNKCELPNTQINVEIDGVDVY